MVLIRRLCVAAALLAASSAGSVAQSIGIMVNPPPADGTIYGYLLTDGTLLYQGGNLFDWWKFSPDQYGSYLNGTWTQVASLPPDYGPYATTGAVLPDGRLLLIGGEYLVQGGSLVFTFTNKSAVYDPISNAWTPVAPPPGWAFIGDSPCTVLADGRLLLGQKFSKRVAALDPKTLTWTELANTGKNDFNAEEGWTLLPDGSVLTVDVKDHPRTERFLPSGPPATTQWISAGDTLENLQGPPSVPSVTYGNGRIYYPPGEVGPALLRPDGTVFATGSLANGSLAGHTAIWHPGPRPVDRGFWTDGPDFPAGLSAGDSWAVLLPDGHVLVETNPAGADLGDLQRLARIRSGAIAPHSGYPAPSVEAAPAASLYYFFEFDGAALNVAPVTFSGGPASLLLLPTGEVDMNGQALYVPADGYAPDLAPVVIEYPRAIARGGSYAIAGKQFNGVSQANAFGDEFPVATNFPLVRIINDATGRVVYARTHDHTSMGVATGNRIVATHFDVPDTIEPGPSLLEVVANGIPSRSVPVVLR